MSALDVFDGISRQMWDAPCPRGGWPSCDNESCLSCRFAFVRAEIAQLGHAVAVCQLALAEESTFVRAAEAEIDRLGRLLKDAEWASNNRECPWCKSVKDWGHTKDCPAFGAAAHG
jgi:hypothetical protein